MGSFRETSVGAIFQNRVQELGDQACVAYKNAQGVYTDISWRRMDEMVRKVGCYLLSKGIKPGDKVALFSPNRYEWWVVDLAILSVGAVNVPIYATNSAQEARYIIINSDAVMCFAGEREHLDKVLKVRGETPELREVVIFDDLESPVEGVLDLRAVMEAGIGYDGRAEFDARIRGIKPGDMATIIYTSGTTGDPKGVMLSHDNFISNVNQLYSVDPELFKEEHTLLSFLPLSHSFERTVG
ncbi:MAG: AMP-binding protein, partial [Deltaproteobacteria bacterium]|nr:AMP-binding protein [Deltaproteobacteria bacterium]